LELGEVTIFFVIFFYGMLFGWTFLGARLKELLREKFE